jgi:alkylation response protein AidB-like acyl-CoA dehydrogenase
VNLEATDEQQQLRDTVRRFLADRATISDHARAMLDDPKGTTEPVWAGLAQLGVMGLLIPAEHGGTGMGMVEVGVVSEELGAALDPGPWLSSAVAAPRALARFEASDAADLYAGLADGSIIATVAGLSPGATLATVARRNGGQAVLSGSFADVPDAAAADTLLVLAEEDGHVTLAATVTSAATVTLQPGIDRTRMLFEVVLDDAPARVLATANRRAVEALVDDVVIASAADAVGAARRLLQMTVEYAKVRKQFGQPIGSFQAVAHLCVDMYETVELAASGVMYALWAADEADARERHLAALRVKALSDRLATVGDQAIQVFGGIGFTWEHDAHLYLKRLLSFSRFLGGAGSFQERIGREMVSSIS